MKTQKERISEFLDGMTDLTLSAEQQIMLFSQDENFEGATSEKKDGENKQCINNTAICGGSTNGACTNYNLNCNKSKNTVCESFNTSIGSCGGEGGDS